jgi:hypothetical protein
MRILNWTGTVAAPALVGWEVEKGTGDVKFAAQRVIGITVHVVLLMGKRSRAFSGMRLAGGLSRLPA